MSMFINQLNPTSNGDHSETSSAFVSTPLHTFPWCSKTDTIELHRDEERVPDIPTRKALFYIFFYVEL